MKKLVFLMGFLLVLSACEEQKDSGVMIKSIGSFNKVLVVTKPLHWQGAVGDELRRFMGKLIYGLPQPETTFSVTHLAPKGFGNLMNKNRNILVVEENEQTLFRIKKDVYAAPQTIIYVSAPNSEALVDLLQQHAEEIKTTFKEADLKAMQSVFAQKKHPEDKYKTLQNLGLSLTIPQIYRTVDDTGEFLWLRQHLMSGIAKGDGTNNILVYSVPLEDEASVAQNILALRDTIGKRYLPGSKEGMYMITEAAFTPKTSPTTIADKQAYETRGKWEVKNDFMAGPFLNYTIVDKEHNRVLVFEGFTYAPSVNKREFIFELEAIAKSLKIL